MSRSTVVALFGVLAFCCRTALAAVIPAPPAPPAPPVPPPEDPAPIVERGEYADSFVPLKDQVRDYEKDPANRYTYCIRTIATYECLAYGSDGAIRRHQIQAVAHGTGFAYKADKDETYLLTNQHVATWPQVTDAGHSVDDVPAGCKLVNTSLKIVDNEEDNYGGDDIPLAAVVGDDALDVAVVKAHAKLRLMPYRIGRSAGLDAGDVVMVRGFPLGAFQAFNTGKIVNTVDHDDYKDWDHLDFIIDAPLSGGNSGSPVFAVSKHTGEYELVGIFHASYTRANELNAVIAIDQLRDLITTLKRPSRDTSPSAEGGPDQRAELDKALSRPEFLPYLALGPLNIAVQRAGDGLLFGIYSRGFPLDDHHIALLAEGAAGHARAWFGNERGLKPYDPAVLDSDSQALVQSVLRRLHGLLLTTLRYRTVSERAPSSREAVTELAALKRVLQRRASADQDLAQQIQDLADRLAPPPSEQALSYGAVLAGLAQPAHDEVTAQAGTVPGK